MHLQHGSSRLGTIDCKQGFSGHAVAGTGERDTAIHHQLETYPWEDQRVPADQFLDAGSFSRRGLKELAPSGQISEQVQNLDGGPRRATLTPSRDRLSPEHLQAKAAGIQWPSGGDDGAGDGGDAGQGFASKTQCRDGVQLFLAVDLAGGMALKGYGNFFGGDPVAVVDDLNLLNATGLDLNRDLAGPGVDGVFDQFFDHRRRTFHHLSGGDLGGQAWRKDLNRH